MEQRGITWTVLLEVGDIESRLIDSLSEAGSKKVDVSWHLVAVATSGASFGDTPWSAAGSASRRHRAEKSSDREKTVWFDLS